MGRGGQRARVTHRKSCPPPRNLIQFRFYTVITIITNSKLSEPKNKTMKTCFGKYIPDTLFLTNFKKLGLDTLL